MYERFYNLRERPFALSPDPEYLYLSRVHREALDYVRYGIESRAGFIVITGEIGAGKTTLLQTLLQRVDERTVVARLVNTTLDPRELLESIILDFGLDTTGKSKPVLLRDLGQFLVQQRANGRRPLVVVDEAQNLSVAALEEIRLLSNLETDKSKLLQVLLVGQPNLRDKLASAELEQFRQRIAVSYHLTPLDAADTDSYINYRLQHAAMGRAPHFPSDAAALVHALSHGVPRTINVICDAVLVFGYAEERRDIDRALVEEAVRELQETGVLPQSTADSTSTAPAPSIEGPAAQTAAVPVQSSAALMPAPPAAPERSAIAPTSIMPPPEPVVATPEPFRSIAPSPQPAVREQSRPRAGEPLSTGDATAGWRDRPTPHRDVDLVARERALEARERQIAEQRRIMAEEYRLLRRRAQPIAPVATGRASAGLSPATASRATRLRTDALHNPGPRVATPGRPSTLWRRIVRLLVGEPAV